MVQLIESKLVATMWHAAAFEATRAPAWGPDHWTALAAAIAAAATVFYCLLTVVAIVYARKQIDFAREQLNAAKADREETTRWRRLALLEEFNRRWTSELLLEARQLTNRICDKEDFAQFWWEKDAENARELFVVAELANFLEYLAMSENWGLIDREALLQVYEPVIKHYGKIFAPVMIDDRMSGQLPYFLALYSEIEAGVAAGETPAAPAGGTAPTS